MAKGVHHQILASRLRTAPHRTAPHRTAGKIVTLTVGNSYRYPAFQFDDATASVREAVTAVNVLLDAAADPWGLASWWLTPPPRACPTGGPRPTSPPIPTPRPARSSRFSGMAIAFNCAQIVGGLTPFLATYLIQSTGNNLMPGYIVAVSAVIGILGLRGLPETGKSALLKAEAPRRSAITS